MHSTTGVSPCSLFLKREVHTRFDLLRPDPESRVEEKQARQKVDHDRHARYRQFTVGQEVMAKNLRPGPDWVPAVVVEKLGPLSYLVETSESILWRRHVDHLKERVTRENTQPAQASVAESVPVMYPEGEQDRVAAASDLTALPPDAGQLVVPERASPCPTTPTVVVNAPPVIVTTPQIATTPPTPVVPKQYPRRSHAHPNWYRPGH